MVWWQGILVIIGLAIAGAVAGFITGALILRLRNKPLPSLLHILAIF